MVPLTRHCTKSTKNATAELAYKDKSQIETPNVDKLLCAILQLPLDLSLKIRLAKKKFKFNRVCL